MSKIRILAISPDEYGVGKYRILDPYTYLKNNYKEEFEVDVVFEAPNNESLYKNYDIVVLHSFLHKTSHEHNLFSLEKLKKSGVTIIVDIDDLWSVDTSHPMYHTIRVHKLGEKKIEILKLADYVTTTTPLFAKTLKDKLNLKNILIFPNAVNEDEEQFKPNKIKSDRIRFGWLGGSTHEKDLSLMSEGINEILDKYNNKVQFVLCGFDLRGTMTEIIDKSGTTRERPIKPSESVWTRYEKIFTNNFKYLDEDYKNFLSLYQEIKYNDSEKSYVRRWTKNISTYATNYNFFDVSLSPITENIFNYNKSQLKIIESGFHKNPMIASEYGPYTIDLINAIENGNFNNNGNALLVSHRKNHKQWFQYMKKLIESPNMIEDLGNKLYETVKDKYSLKNVTKDRVQFFKTIKQ
jgi:glycosyltransferase involved in cell wall biosynthesis